MSHVGVVDYPTGIFNRTFSMAKELSKLGHDVTITATQNKKLIFPYKKEYRHGIKIVSFPSFLPMKIRKLGYAILPIVLKFLFVQNKKFDICHCDNHRPTSFIPLWLYSKIQKTKIVVEWMDLFGKGGLYDDKSKIWKSTLGFLDNYLEKKAIKSADGVVVLSDFLKKRAIDLGVNSNCIEKIWGGSDIDTINFTHDSQKNRRKYSIPENSFVCSVGNMTEHEMELYEADLKRILNLTDNILIIRTGPFSIKYHQIFKNRLIQFGYKTYNEYCELLSVSDFFLLLQKNNIRQISRWPNIIGDFIAAGRPTVITPAGESAICLNMHPEAFILFNSHDKSDVFLKKIKNKCTFSNKTRIRKIAEKNFNWKYRSIQLSQFYKKTIKTKKLQ